MPRLVRNFWLTLSVTGKKTDVATGPRSAAGGFHLKILMREDGAIHGEDITVQGVNQNGLLEVSVWTKNECVFRRTTKR